MSVYTSRFAIGLKLKKNMGNFRPLEVVDRGSESQLEVGEKWFISLFKG